MIDANSVFLPDVWGMKELLAALLGVILHAGPGVVIYHRRIHPLSLRHPEALWFGGIFSIFIAQIAQIFFLKLIGAYDVLWSLILLTVSITSYIWIPQRLLPMELKENRNWTGGEWILVAGLIVVILVTVLIPFRRLGETIPDGIVFRHYFSVDYLKHLSITGSLLRGEMPPPNPYVNGFQLHYYWLYYLLPMFSYRIFGNQLSLLHLLIAYNLIFIVLFIPAFFSALRCLTRSLHWRLLALSGLAGLTSYEGLLGCFEVYRKGLPWNQISQYNIDALTRQWWAFPQIDTLYRSYLYTTPQILSYIFLVVIFLILQGSHPRLTHRQALILGTATAGCFAYNFFIGAAILCALLITTLCFMLQRTTGFKYLLQGFAWTIIPVASALVLFYWFRMFVTNPGFLRFDPSMGVIRYILPILIVNFGVLFFLGPTGLAMLLYRLPLLKRDKRYGLVFLPVLLILSCLLIMFFRVEGFPGDVGLKLGQMLNVMLALLIGGWGCSSSNRTKKWFLWIGTIMVFCAVPTLIIDIYNSQDIWNQEYRAVFDPDDMAAMKWANENLPLDAVIQAIPDRDGNMIHSRYVPLPAHIVSSFALRQSVIADKFHAMIYLNAGDECERRRRIIYRLYETLDFKDAFFIINEMGIDVICVGKQERSWFPEGSAKFNLFPRLYAAGNCSLVQAVERTGTLWDFSSDPMDSFTHGGFSRKICWAVQKTGSAVRDEFSRIVPSDIGDLDGFRSTGSSVASFSFPCGMLSSVQPLYLMLESSGVADSSQFALVFARIGEELKTLASVPISDPGVLVPFHLDIPTDCREIFFTGGNLSPYQQLHFLFPNQGHHDMREKD